MNSPHKGQWCGTLMFSLICAWINCWINSLEAGDLKYHRAHYDRHCNEMRDISFTHNLLIRCEIENLEIARRSKFQNDFRTALSVMEEQDFGKVAFTILYRGAILYSQQSFLSSYLVCEMRYIQCQIDVLIVSETVFTDLSPAFGMQLQFIDSQKHQTNIS